MFSNIGGFRSNLEKSLEPMFLRTKVETNYVVVSSEVRPSYSVNLTRFGDVRKFCCFES